MERTTTRSGIWLHKAKLCPCAGEEGKEGSARSKKLKEGGGSADLERTIVKKNKGGRALADKPSEDQPEMRLGSRKPGSKKKNWC